jgi:hypothetical protein
LPEINWSKGQFIKSSVADSLYWLGNVKTQLGGAENKVTLCYSSTRAYSVWIFVGLCLIRACAFRVSFGQKLTFEEVDKLWRGKFDRHLLSLFNRLPGDLLGKIMGTTEVGGEPWWTLRRVRKLPKSVRECRLIIEHIAKEASVHGRTQWIKEVRLVMFLFFPIVNFSSCSCCC